MCCCHGHDRVEDPSASGLQEWQSLPWLRLSWDGKALLGILSIKAIDQCLTPKLQRLATAASFSWYYTRRWLPDRDLLVRLGKPSLCAVFKHTEVLG